MTAAIAEPEGTTTPDAKAIARALLDAMLTEAKNRPNAQQLVRVARPPMPHMEVLHREYAPAALIGLLAEMTHELGLGLEISQARPVLYSRPGEATGWLHIVLHPIELDLTDLLTAGVPSSVALFRLELGHAHNVFLVTQASPQTIAERLQALQQQREKHEALTTQLKLARSIAAQCQTRLASRNPRYDEIMQHLTVALSSDAAEEALLQALRAANKLGMNFDVAPERPRPQYQL